MIFRDHAVFLERFNVRIALVPWELFLFAARQAQNAFSRWYIFFRKVAAGS